MIIPATDCDFVIFQTLDVKNCCYSTVATFYIPFSNYYLATLLLLMFFSLHNLNSCKIHCNNKGAHIGITVPYLHPKTRGCVCVCAFVYI